MQPLWGTVIGRYAEATRARFAAAANLASTDLDSVMRSLASSLRVQW